MDIDEAWIGFLDDAAPDAHPVTGAVGARVVPDLDLPTAADDVPLVVDVSTGAGGLAGPVELARRRGLQVRAFEVSLADAGDPAGNARRVVAALTSVETEARVHLRMDAAPTPSWLAAADEASAAELCLTLPLGPEVEAWIDAALDRELRFSLRGGSVADAVAALRTTARLWGDADDLTAARRWCLSWRCTDVDDALPYLEDL